MSSCIDIINWNDVLINANTSGGKQIARGLAILSQYTVIEMIEAIETLLVYCNNLILFPTDEKYRKIKISNIHYQERLGHLNGSIICMDSIGYKIKADYLRLQIIHSDDLNEIKDILSNTLTCMKSNFIVAPLYDYNYQFLSVKGVGSHHNIGIRKSMEDEEVIIDQYCSIKTQGFYAVYDGHGGRESVDFVAKALHRNFQQALLQHQNTIDLAFIQSYIKTDNQIRRQNIFRSGTTAVTCFIREEYAENTHTETSSNETKKQRVLYTANVGDSRAILIRNNNAIRLTIDHKPNLPEETARIEKAGGHVIDNRVNRVLAVSRALGDHMLKHNDLVSPEPYCTTTILSPKTDSFLILACDGVWDVITDQKACDFVIDTYQRIYQENSSKLTINQILAHVAQALVELSLEMKSKDNITVMIIKL